MNPTLHTIAKRTGETEAKINWFLVQYALAKKEIGNDPFEQWRAGFTLRGYLLSPKVLKANFGEEDALRIGMDVHEYILQWALDRKESPLEDRSLDELKKIAISDWKVFKSQGKIKPIWQLHGDQMLPMENLEDIVNYFKENMLKEETE